MNESSLDWTGRAEEAGKWWSELSIVQEGANPKHLRDGFRVGAMWQRTALFDDDAVDRLAELLWSDAQVEKYGDDGPDEGGWGDQSLDVKESWHEIAARTLQALLT